MDLISIKDFCALYQCNMAGIYQKINRLCRNDIEFGKHIWKRDGRTMLDEYAQLALIPGTYKQRQREEEQRQKETEFQQQAKELERLKGLEDEYLRHLDFIRDAYDIQDKQEHLIFMLNLDLGEKTRKIERLEKELDELRQENEQLKAEAAESPFKKLFGKK